jgi:hypothetical protein
MPMATIKPGVDGVGLESVEQVAFLVMALTPTPFITLTASSEAKPD